MISYLREEMEGTGKKLCPEAFKDDCGPFCTGFGMKKWSE
jgi:hypothetical protein